MRLKSIVEDFYPVMDKSDDGRYDIISIYDSESPQVELCSVSVKNNYIVINMRQEAYDYSSTDAFKIIQMAIGYAGKFLNKKDAYVKFGDSVQDETIKKLVNTNSIIYDAGVYSIGNINNDGANLYSSSKSDYDMNLMNKFSAYSWKPKDAKPVKNAENYDLVKAVTFHELNMKGKRWPELEQAFLHRSNTYTGKGVSDYTRPRKSLFKYLSNINERWPEGDNMATATIKKFVGPYFGRNRYFVFTDDVMQYVYSKAPHLMYDIGLGIYKNLYIPWARNSSFFGYLDFQNIDFSSDSAPLKFIELFKKDSYRPTMDGTELAISNIRKFNHMYSVLSRSKVLENNSNSGSFSVDVPYSEVQQTTVRQVIPILLTTNNSKSKTVTDALYEITSRVIDVFSLPTFNNKYYIDKIDNIADKVESLIGKNTLKVIFDKNNQSIFDIHNKSPIDEKDVDVVIKAMYQVIKVAYELIDDSKRAVQMAKSRLNS